MNDAAMRPEAKPFRASRAVTVTGPPSGDIFICPGSSVTRQPTRGPMVTIMFDRYAVCGLLLIR